MHTSQPAGSPDELEPRTCEPKAAKSRRLDGYSVRLQPTARAMRQNGQGPFLFLSLLSGLEWIAVNSGAKAKLSCFGAVGVPRGNPTHDKYACRATRNKPACHCWRIDSRVSGISCSTLSSPSPERSFSLLIHLRTPCRSSSRVISLKGVFA
jgi:hypothetical protein